MVDDSTDRRSNRALRQSTLDTLLQRFDRPVMYNVYRGDWVECLIGSALGPDWFLPWQRGQDWAGWELAYLGLETAVAVQNWLQVAQIDSGPLFRRVRRGSVVGTEPLHPDSVRRIVCERARQARVSGRIGSHSFRVGSAEELAARGAGLVEMQQAGGWKNPAMPVYYARNQLAGKGAIARHRYGVGNSETGEANG